jgi:hypothetical protein
MLGPTLSNCEQPNWGVRQNHVSLSRDSVGACLVFFGDVGGDSKSPGSSKETGSTCIVGFLG